MARVFSSAASPTRHPRRAPLRPYVLDCRPSRPPAWPVFSPLWPHRLAVGHHSDHTCSRRVSPTTSVARVCLLLRGHLAPTTAPACPRLLFAASPSPPVYILLVPPYDHQCCTRPQLAVPASHVVTSISSSSCQLALLVFVHESCVLVMLVLMCL